MDLSIHDPLTMLVFGGIIFLLLPSLKINGSSIEIIKGSEKYLYMIGAILCATGVYLFIHGPVITSTPQEILTPEDRAPEPVISIEKTKVETPTEVEVNITYPSNASKVNMYENVIGSAENIPDGYHIWIFGYSHSSGMYYPRPESVEFSNNVEWSLSSPMQIGSEKSVGNQYDIIAVLANKEDDIELTSYIENCEQNGEWPGMNKDEIPSDIIICDNNTVTRR